MPVLPPPRPISHQRPRFHPFHREGTGRCPRRSLRRGRPDRRAHAHSGGRTLLSPARTGCPISHAAVTLAARVGCLLIWIGEAGVRLYAAGQPGGARADRLLHQARLALDPNARLKIVRKMYDMRFGRTRPAAPVRGSVAGNRRRPCEGSIRDAGQAPRREVEGPPVQAR